MIQGIIDRLKDKTSLLIEAAEDMDALARGTAAKSGTAFVIPFRERAEPNELAAGGFRQLVAVQFLVAFLVRQHSDAKGGKKALVFDQLKSTVEAALAGYQLTDDADPMELVAAQAAPLGNGVTVYVQTWQTSRYLEA